MRYSEIVYCGLDHLLICDGRCEKAWGINSRPRVSGTVFADSELGDAPADPGTREGGEGKPKRGEEMNKWCARECERSVMSPTLPNWEHRHHEAK